MLAGRGGEPARFSRLQACFSESGATVRLEVKSTLLEITWDA